MPWWRAASKASNPTCAGCCARPVCLATRCSNVDVPDCPARRNFSEGHRRVVGNSGHAQLHRTPGARRANASYQFPRATCPRRRLPDAHIGRSFGCAETGACVVRRRWAHLARVPCSRHVAYQPPQRHRRISKKSLPPVRRSQDAGQVQTHKALLSNACIQGNHRAKRWRSVDRENLWFLK
jgi:hypothetical protein